SLHQQLYFLIFGLFDLLLKASWFPASFFIYIQNQGPLHNLKMSDQVNWSLKKQQQIIFPAIDDR
ncbi:hypothetical protein, partial [Cecembia lonarensis]|uniref:hypothetical protein n=1 Tax=Cecembia lonarensis TaxID=645110 RepID=UPI0005900291